VGSARGNKGKQKAVAKMPLPCATLGVIGQVASHLFVWPIMTNKISDKTIALLRYREAHPEVSYRRLGKLFGISLQRAWQIVKEDKRNRMVVEYFRTHPGVSPAEVRAIFHISLQRAHSLMPGQEARGRG